MHDALHDAIQRVEEKIEKTTSDSYHEGKAGLEFAFQSLTEEIWDTPIGQRLKVDLDRLEEVLKDTKQNIQADIQSHVVDIKRTIKRELLRQRDGWDRWSRSIRNHIGLVLGSLATFSGGLTRQSRRRLLALQSGQYTWMATRNLPSVGRNRTKLERINDPFWINDVLSVGVASSILLQQEEGHILSAFAQQAISIATILQTVFRSARRILQVMQELEPQSEYDDNLIASLAALLGTTGLIVLPIPTPLLAGTLAGTQLMVDSIIDEVVGNWFDMMQRIGPDRLRLPQRLYNAACKKLEYNVFLPAQNVLLELEDYYLSLTDGGGGLQSSSHRLQSGELLRDQVRKAAAGSFRLRLHWTIASMGVLLQMLLIQRHYISSIGEKVLAWLVRPSEDGPCYSKLNYYSPHGN